MSLDFHIACDVEGDSLAYREYASGLTVGCVCRASRKVVVETFEVERVFCRVVYVYGCRIPFCGGKNIIERIACPAVFVIIVVKAEGGRAG